MALVCDTGPVYALYDADDAHHATVKAAIEAEPGPLFLPVILLAELDYLLHVRLGIDAALDFLESIEQGSFTLVLVTREDLSRCRELMTQYRDLGLGLADCSVIATAERLGIQRILTVDERHFRAVQPRRFSHFILIPADGR
jgi:predicted nucleic acid-binding protein